jgi:multiple sugar transport system substrate-binding protein
MNAKKIALVLILGLLAAGLAVAGGAKEAPKAAQAAAVQLEFPSWQAEEAGFKDFWKQLIDAYQAQKPNVTIKLSQIPFKDYIDTLTTRFAAGNPPDILHLPARNAPQFAAQNWLEALDGPLAGTDILSNWTPLQASMVKDGQNLGLLLMGYGFLLFYNEKLLAEAGVAMPRDPAAFLAAARAATREKDGIYGIGLTTTDHPNVYNDAASVVFGQKLNFFKGDQYNFTDPEVVKAVDLYRELTKYAPRGVTTEMKRQLFADGKLAMTIDGPWVIAMLKKPELKYGMLPFPAVAGAPSNSMHLAAGLKAEKKQLVVDFIKLIATPDFQAKYTVATKSPAGRKGVLTAEMLKQYPELDLVNKAAALAVGTWPGSLKARVNEALYAKLVGSGMIRLMLTNEPTARILDELQQTLVKEIK